MLNIDIVCLDIQYRICAISYVKTYDIVCQNIRYHMSTSLLYDIVCPCKDIVLTIGTPNFLTANGQEEAQARDFNYSHATATPPGPCRPVTLMVKMGPITTHRHTP